MTLILGRRLAAGKSTMLISVSGKPRLPPATVVNTPRSLIAIAEKPRLLIATHGTQTQLISILGKPKKVNFAALNKTIQHCFTAKEIDSLIMKIDHVNDVNVATAYRIMMKNRSTNQVAYRKLEELSRPISFAPRPLSSILHSIASTGHFTKIPHVFIQKLEKTNLVEFSAFDISNTVWALAKLNCKDDAFFDKVVVEVQTRNLQQFNDQALANILWACATLGYKNDVMLTRVSQHLVTRDLSTAKPQDIANITWTLAKLDYKDNALLALFAQMLQSRDLSTFKPQEIANILWALAKLEYNHQFLFSRIAQDLAARGFSTFNPQDTANILWAFANLGCKNDALFVRLAQDLMTRDLSTATPQAVANIVWACATLNYKNDAFFTRFAQDLMTRDLSTFTPQAIANIAWAFAVSRVSAPALLQRFADAVLSSNSQLAVSEMTTQAVSNLLYACALVNYRNNALLNEFAHELSSREGLSPQDCCNSMWAFACLDALKLKEVKQWFSKPSTVALQKRDIIPAQARQLFQVKLAWQQTHGKPFPMLLETVCKGEWIDAVLLAADEKEPESSHVHLRIAKMLEKSFTLQNEANLLGGISVDILIPKHNAVVEVDGPFHFFSNQLDFRTGATVFKHRLLERAGYKLISVPVSKFMKADAQQYINELERRITM